MSETKLKSLFASLNLEALDADEQEEVLLKMGELIFKDTLLRCLESLSEEDRQEFGKIVENNASEDEVAIWITEHVPSADAYVAQSVESLADDILSVTSL